MKKYIFLPALLTGEAAYEPYEGKLAVANVVLNRVRSSNYPNSITRGLYIRSHSSQEHQMEQAGPSAKFQNRLNSGIRTQECMDAALEALSGKNNIGGYTSFRMVSITNLSAMSDYVIIGGHVFH